MAALPARATRMKITRGKYFYFMDSDDWAEPDMLSDMVELAERVNAQYVVAGYYIDTYYSDSDYLTVNLSYPDVVYKSRDEFRQNAHRLFDRNLLYTPWNKLYLAEYLNENGITFPQTFWDDFPFNLSVLRDVERVAVTSKQYYHFMRARAESETAKYVPQMYDKREEEHQWMQDLYRHWGVDNAESREFVARRYIERVIGCVENVTNKQCVLPAAEKKGEIRRIICDPKVAQSLKEMHPRSLMMKLMLMPIRMRSVVLTNMQSRLISWVKSRNTRLFASLKARR
jgi:glycosyltransferase involved in cell wall biosynthesis